MLLFQRRIVLKNKQRYIKTCFMGILGLFVRRSKNICLTLILDAEDLAVLLKNKSESVFFENRRNPYLFKNRYLYGTGLLGKITESCHNSNECYKKLKTSQNSSGFNGKHPTQKFHQIRSKMCIDRKGHSFQVGRYRFR